MNILSTFEIYITLSCYHIHITFIDLYVYIGVITDLYGVVVVVCTGVCVDKDSSTASYCGTMIAFDVGEVVACNEVVVVVLYSGDLTAIRAYFIP